MRPSRQLSPTSGAHSWSPARHPYTWWSRLSPLARDVTLVLIVKAIVLGLLWFAFFRSPAAPQMTMDPQRVEQNLLTPTVLAPAPSLELSHAIR